MQVHGMAVQHEVFPERGHEVYEPYPSPNVPTPQCVELLLAASVFLIYVMLFSNLELLHCPCFPIFSLLYNQRRSFLPQCLLEEPLPEAPSRILSVNQDLLTTRAS